MQRPSLKRLLLPCVALLPVPCSGPAPWPAVQQLLLCVRVQEAATAAAAVPLAEGAAAQWLGGRLQGALPKVGSTLSSSAGQYQRGQLGPRMPSCCLLRGISSLAVGR